MYRITLFLILIFILHFVMLVTIFLFCVYNLLHIRTILVEVMTMTVGDLRSLLIV